MHRVLQYCNYLYYRYDRKPADDDRNVCTSARRLAFRHKSFVPSSWSSSLFGGVRPRTRVKRWRQEEDYHACIRHSYNVIANQLSTTRKQNTFKKKDNKKKKKQNPIEYWRLYGSLPVLAYRVCHGSSSNTTVLDYYSIHERYRNLQSCAR
jgi:hypothetical protein